MRRLSILLMFALVACGGSQGGPGKGPGGHGEKVDQPDPVSVVETIVVATGSVSEVLITSAIVESESQADLFPIANGTVIEIRKEEGDVVKAGDVLAVIDNATLDASAERAASEVRRVEADYERLKTLHSSGAVSERELTEAKYALTAARTSLREATRGQGQTRITAPFDGVVAARDVRVGESASAGGRAYQVVDPNHLRVVASMPERDLSRVRVGQRAKLVSAYDDTLTASGVVQRIAPVIDPTSGTFRVTVSLQEGQTAMRPGQYVSVQLEVDRHDGVTTVPRQALVFEDGLPFVYRFGPAPEEQDEAEEPEPESKGGFASWFGSKSDADEKKDAKGPRWVAQKVRVHTGISDSESVEIDDGVVLGDEVVVVGQSNLKDGAPVITPGRLAEQEAAKQAKKDTDATDGGADGSEG